MDSDYNENKINLQSLSWNSTRQNIQLDKNTASDNGKCIVYLQNCFKNSVIDTTTISKHCLCRKKKNSRREFIGAQTAWAGFI